MRKVEWQLHKRKRLGQPWQQLNFRSPEPFRLAVRQRIIEVNESDGMDLSPGELLITLALRGDVRLRQLYAQFKKDASKGMTRRS